MIIDYYSDKVKRIKAIQEIAKAEDIEIKRLNDNLAKVELNMRISTADEEGIAAFESILGITPEAGSTLEDRRFNVLVKKNKRKLNIKEVVEIIGRYSKGATADTDFNNDIFQVTLINDEEAVTNIYDAIDQIIPPNVRIIFMSLNDYWTLDGAHKLDGTMKLGAVKKIIEMEG